MAFVLPVVKSKPHLNWLHGLPCFSFHELTDKDEIGRGSFGAIFTAKYLGKTVVLKKLLCQGMEEVKSFKKEAKMLANLSHPNIAVFRGVCANPYSIMLNFEVFDFKQFKMDNKVYSLDGYLRLLESMDEVQSFSAMFPRIATDVASGLQYLHSQGVAHRDMKPGNILVSNTHYLGEFHDSSLAKLSVKDAMLVLYIP